MGKKKYQWYWDFIQKNNKGRHKKTIKKLYNRALRARRQWKKLHNLDKKDTDKLLKEALGTECKYCGKEVTAENFSLDHNIPESAGGENKLSNFDVICNKCNKQKGEMTGKEYKELLDCIDNFREEGKKYVLKQLSMHYYYG